ncbi:MAG: site-specific integrase [Cyclobacteriaceae bacterium]|nr:site-specific integrase [Cyclobacteriaceae bacterium]
MAENLILKDPTAGLSIRRTNEFHKEVLSEEEIKLLAQTLCGNDDVRRAFLFSCFTGVGLAEATELTLANIKGDRFWYVRKKTNKKVNLVLHNSARLLLGAQLTKTEPVFKFPSSTAVNKCLQNWVERAGIEDKKITFYSARHSFATNLLRNGVNLKTVADCLGHTTVHHTVKYLHYVDGLKDEAISSLSVL